MEKYTGKCDICTKPDGSHNQNLQKCSMCNVLVHELCYGMVPTTTKNTTFICHACKSIGMDIEVNGTSKIGGIGFKDILLKREGRDSLMEFISTTTVDDKQKKYANVVRMLEFYNEVQEFSQSQQKDGKYEERMNETPDEVEEMFGDLSLAIKERAQQIFDTYIAKDAATKKLNELPSNILTEIDTKLFNDDNDTRIECTLFDDASKVIRQTLLNYEETLYERYKQSSLFTTYLQSQRTTLKQIERPTECVLCSVASGVHAMHPLYDDHGKDGRQLVLPASGVGFKRKEKRLAWVHTLCAMFISSHQRTGHLIFGCDEDGEYEMPDEEGDEDEGRKKKVIGGNDDSDEDDDDSDIDLLEKEQMNFTNAEIIFNQLIQRLDDATNNEVATVALECINAMIENVEVLHPAVIEKYPIGNRLKSAKKTFETTNPELKARCKLLTAEMKRVYAVKKKKIPEGFVPVLNGSKAVGGGGSANNAAAKVNGKDDDQAVHQKCTGENGKDKNAAGQLKNDKDYDDDSIVVSEEDCKNAGKQQKYEIGTTVKKEFNDGVTYSGRITVYNSDTKLYRVVYTDGDDEDLTQNEVSDLLSTLTYTANFCISTDSKARRDLNDLRELQCVICKKTSKTSLKIPVQCSALEKAGEFEELSKFTKRAAGKQKCCEAMHVGCARWAASLTYAKINDKNLKMCYYFPGMPPTYSGEGYKDTISKCFCRVHAREIQDGQAKESSGTAPSLTNDRKRKSSNEDCSKSEHYNSEDSEKERRLQADIARKKKKRRIMEESDEEESD